MKYQNQQQRQLINMSQRRSASPIVFILLFVFIFDSRMLVKSQPFYQGANELMPLSYPNQKDTLRDNPIENCFKPDDFCNYGPKGCCSGGPCRCNLWGYNCRCSFDENVPVSYDEEKPAVANANVPMHNDPTEKRSSQAKVYQRSCIKRGGACDHRPHDCCYSSSCRCNLWGSNCRCQRMGLFQKWG
ncbi:uncharacterized protein LOC129920570 [Episyrphus balteatus]|uniref:uncharacterized protein LOC129920570 n=1 Tax=Episyrphus balteatus TaxID=286459 RepID=UPI00248531EA|nr:uncharacterized protein LOC129920570 [Episyrphus balteatus]